MHHPVRLSKSKEPISVIPSYRFPFQNKTKLDLLKGITIVLKLFPFNLRILVLVLLSKLSPTNRGEIPRKRLENGYFAEEASGFFLWVLEVDFAAAVAGAAEEFSSMESISAKFSYLKT